MFLDVRDIKKSYGGVENSTQILNGISLGVERGQMCVILGPSGSGKSTLLNTIGGLDRVDEGQIVVDGLDISKLKSKELSLYRRNYLGFIFQFYNLVPNLTLREKYTDV